MATITRFPSTTFRVDASVLNNVGSMWLVETWEHGHPYSIKQWFVTAPNEKAAAFDAIRKMENHLREEAARDGRV